MLISLITFFACILLVLAGTWYLTRHEKYKSSVEYFLAGHGLSFPFIAGSLLLTDLDAEELVGLNGSAFVDGLCIMVWEVGAVVAILLAANIFLPRMLRFQSATIPDMLERRFQPSTAMAVNILFILAYIFTQIPIVLYSGAQMLRSMFGMDKILSDIGICGDYSQLLVIVALLAVCGAFYALWGGLKTCVVSDTLSGIGWLVGGFLVLYFGLSALGDGGNFFSGISVFFREGEKLNKLNSLGSADSSVPFFTVFTGALALSCFYWCSNQFILQRALGGRSLAESQKGMLLGGALKLLSPFYLVFPGIIAAIMVAQQMLPVSVPDQVYGAFVRHVVPRPVLGFLAAVFFGGIISTFDSLLNAVCTLFSLNVYKKLRPDAPDRTVIRIGFWFGIVLTVLSIFLSPLCYKAGRIFEYMISCLSVYSIPIFYAVILGLFCRKASTKIVNTGIVLTFLIMLAKLFFKKFPGGWLGDVNDLHFVAIVLAASLLIGWLFSKLFPAEKENAVTAWIFSVNCFGYGKEQDQSKDGFDYRPWRSVFLYSVILLLIVIGIYVYFADWSVI